ncbi:hypothetical protein Gotri_026207, partial [Gossypium trilobum]|nr:hypothetical protein [Gossypium trilobum]
RIPSGNLKQLLIACAKTLSENNIAKFNVLIAKARVAVSIYGEPIQHLDAYMVEGLVARKEASGSNIYVEVGQHAASVALGTARASEVPADRATVSFC